MNLNEYQKAAYKTAVPRAQDVVYMTLGLASEAGEVAGLLKKTIRDGGFSDNEQLKKELGDVLWYVAGICTVMGIDLDDVATANIAKLADRARRGVIGGSGDDR